MPPATDKGTVNVMLLLEGLREELQRAVCAHGCSSASAMILFSNGIKVPGRQLLAALPTCPAAAQGLHAGCCPWPWHSSDPAGAALHPLSSRRGLEFLVPTCCSVQQRMSFLSLPFTLPLQLVPLALKEAALRSTLSSWRMQPLCVLMRRSSWTGAGLCKSGALQVVVQTGAGGEGSSARSLSVWREVLLPTLANYWPPALEGSAEAPGPRAGWGLRLQVCDQGSTDQHFVK